MTRISAEAKLLYRHNQPFAAGFYEEKHAPMIQRLARALRRYCDQAPPPSYTGGRLYPAGSPGIWHVLSGQILSFCYSFSFSYNDDNLVALLERADGPRDRQLLEFIRRDLRSCSPLPGSAKFQVGGWGYTHSILNYGRILREGLNHYRDRVQDKLAQANDVGQQTFYGSLLEVLEGLFIFHRHCVTQLAEQLRARPSEKLQALVDALGKTPLGPAETFYEALVGFNFIWYVDGCDSIGRFDQVMLPYYERSRRDGVPDAEIIGLLREYWANFDVNTGGNMGLGGTAADGGPAYNAFSYLCLESLEHTRRPNSAIRIRRDMPQKFWDRTLQTLATGCSNPALYNEHLYLDNIPEVTGVTGPDRFDYAFGGCTELMFHGISNADSLAAGINLLEILEGSLLAHLPGTEDFAGFLEVYKQDLSANLQQMLNEINLLQQSKALLRPQLIRTLFIDDCLDNGLEYNAGGARINGSVVNVAGFGNAVNSLHTIRALYEGALGMDRESFLDLLEQDFENDPAALARVLSLEKFGNNDAAVNVLAAELAGHVFSEINRRKCWRGHGYFVASCLMFTIFAHEGEDIGATPDGRRAGTPIADSIGPMQGTDRDGPTSMLLSVGSIPQRQAIGTLILNARFDKAMLTKPDLRAKSQALVQTYFEKGGNQLQLTVVDQATLEDAMVHPEKYESLIVRVGGYTEYFTRLSPALKQEVLKRACHAV